jgi:hypothetical protein
MTPAEWPPFLQICAEREQELGVQRLHLLGSLSSTLRTTEPFALPESPRYFEDAFDTQDYPEETGGSEDPDLSTSVSPRSPVTSPLSSTAASSVTPDYTAVTPHISVQSLDLSRNRSCVSGELGIRKEDAMYEADNLNQSSRDPGASYNAGSPLCLQSAFGSVPDHAGCRETDIDYQIIQMQSASITLTVSLT